MYKLIVLAFAAMMMTSSCTENLKFELVEEGPVEACFLQVNTDSAVAKPGDVWNMDFTYYNSSDSLLYSSRDVAQDFLMYAPSDYVVGSVEQGIYLMHKGDSAIFKAPADVFFAEVRRVKVPPYIKSGEMLTFYVKMKDIYDGEEYQRRIDEYNERMEAQELLILHDYIRNEGITAQPSESGLYQIVLSEGKGKEVAAGKIVKVHFSGRFIDGREFDNSYTRNQPFQFQLGQGRSVKGFEEGIATMHKGEKKRLIMPSTLGYGARGVKGRIPAFSSLIFDVELLDIIDK
jgi:FKBP-type peptidyl-prolyl cis-trans isomerase 2